MKEFIKGILQKLNRIGLKNRDFTIIADNCWGNFLYQDFGIEYQTPFVGLFIFSPDYIQLLENFDETMKYDLSFIPAEDSKYIKQLKEANMFGAYPVGKLGKDIEIHFLHYYSEKEALEKWNRRKTRINKNNMLVKFCDRDLCTPELIKRFDALPFEHKICFTARPYPYKSVVTLSSQLGKEMVENEWKNYRKDVDIKKILNGLNKGT